MAESASLGSIPETSTISERVSNKRGTSAPGRRRLSGATWLAAGAGFRPALGSNRRHCVRRCSAYPRVLEQLARDRAAREYLEAHIEILLDTYSICMLSKSRTPARSHANRGGTKLYTRAFEIPQTVDKNVHPRVGAPPTMAARLAVASARRQRRRLHSPV